MKTNLLYLQDTYQFSAAATFREMKESEKGTAVILNETIFYPQGGGQPSDTGIIKSGSTTFVVQFVALDPDGIVWHFGEFTSGTFSAGEQVTLEINQEKREMHAQIHSAGHVIDCALQDLAPELKADKGFHFVEGSYIECAGEAINPEQLVELLQVKVQDIITSDMPVIVADLDEPEAAKLGLVPPSGKGVRTVQFGNYRPVGCGGTHVQSAKMIGGAAIKKIKAKKGRTKISYGVS